MALLNFSTRTVYWKIALNSVDITSAISHYVSSIKIKDSILPSPPTTNKRKGGKEITPGSSASITFIENNYVIDWFQPGSKIQIYMGYDMISPPYVFSGMIMKLPDGMAREMLEYKVKAFGESAIKGAMQEKIRVFPIPQKAAIIAQIAVENGWTPDIVISDTLPISADSIPMSIGLTSLELIQMLAGLWDCVAWFSIPNILHFYDDTTAHSIADSTSFGPLSLPGPYVLGYRTDKAVCNVESVQWRHMNRKAGGPGIQAYQQYDENGIVQSIQQGKILALGMTWELKPNYLRQAVKNPKLFGIYALQAALATSNSQSYQILRKYYRVLPYDKHQKQTPSYAGSGFDVTVTLNNGDSYLKPPRSALLYAGSLNPNADSSYLPAWFYQHNPGFVEPAQLKINETTLEFNRGQLKSKLKCTMAA